MRKSLCLAALLAVFFLSAGRVQAACVTRADVAAEVLVSVPDATASVINDPGALAELTRLYNRIPPLTYAKADAIVVFDTARFPVVYIVLFLDGCRTGASTIPKPVYRRFTPAGFLI